MLFGNQWLELSVVLLPGHDVEVGDRVAGTERMLLNDPHLVRLILDNVVRGPGMPAQPQARAGARVCDVDVLQPPDVGDVLVPGQRELDAGPDQHLQQVTGVGHRGALPAGSGHRDDAALDLLEVCGGGLELAAESFVGDVPGADDDVGLELVQLDDHAVQQVRNEVNGADVEVADVRDRDQRYSSMMTRTEPSLEIMENPVIS